MSCEETCWKLNLKFQNKYANVHVFYFEIMYIISNQIALPSVQTDLWELFVHPFIPVIKHVHPFQLSLSYNFNG